MYCKNCGQADTKHHYKTGAPLPSNPKQCEGFVPDIELKGMNYDGLHRSLKLAPNNS